MASIHLLGVFEDAAQRDFHVGIVRRWARVHGVEIRVEPRLTHGCRFDFLAEFLRGAQLYSGTLVAVDGIEEKLPAFLSRCEASPETRTSSP